MKLSVEFDIELDVKIAIIPILFQDLIEHKSSEQRQDITKDEKLKTCHRILTACRKGNAEILELLMQDLSKDDRVEWPKLISEYLFIHHNSLMNSILFQGFNRFSPYHEISKYLQDFAQENGKYRHSSFNAVPL